MFEEEPKLRNIFLGPVIFMVVVAFACLMWNAQNANPTAVLSYAGLTAIAALTILVFTFLSGGRADILGIEFNGWYFAAIPTGMLLSLIAIAIIY